MNGPRCSTPSHFPPHLIAAIHTRNKAAIAAEVAVSGIGAGIVPYHGIRDDHSCTCGDLNCPDAGKHPDPRLAPHGIRSATQDPYIASQWFACNSDHNLALVLGKELAALDLDPRNGGSLAADYGLPKTMTAISGGGGQHRLYRIRRGTVVQGRLLATGVELRTGNQAVVIENSRHRSGGCYEWLQLDSIIATLPREIKETHSAGDRPGKCARLLPSPILDPLLPSVVPAEEIARVRQALLRDKYRKQARLLLEGRWEDAGHPSQSEAEYQLTLLLSRVTDHPAVWLAVLQASGLGQRDRAGRRGDHGRRHKLSRPDYISALFAKVTAQRVLLTATGDPNLEVAKRVFQSYAPCRTDLAPPPYPSQQENVQDPKKKARGRPHGGGKRHAARIALIRFLGDPDTVTDRNGYIRLPVGPAAEALAMSVETLRLAVHDLVNAGVIEGPEPKPYIKRGHFARDRYLCLLLPYQDAVDRNEKLNLAH